MGSFDGAETCELVGLYILSQLKMLDINVGLYRDDGLATCNKTPRQTELIKKEICRIFSDNKLKITIEANLKSINFLDITMDLRNEEYKPYMKPNNTPLYVHKDSNHPPNIIKNIPENINRRISTLSSNETIFNQAAPPYQEALDRSGYKYKLKYDASQKTTITEDAKKNVIRSRKRNITWFNPPYSQSVAVNIGKQFLNLLDNCFPPSHQLHKLLNRNTVKISYSCTPNVKQIISAHNKTMLMKTKPRENTSRNCNCRDSKACPLDGSCLATGVVYQTTVTRKDNNKQETYIGLTDNTFKTRYNGHNSSFRHKSKQNATTLSQYVWSLKEEGIDYDMKWKIVSTCKAYSKSTKKCNLCIREKYFIICKPHMASLNRRNELASECRHRKRHLLGNT